MTQETQSQISVPSKPKKKLTFSIKAAELLGMSQRTRGSTSILSGLSSHREIPQLRLTKDKKEHEDLFRDSAVYSVDGKPSLYRQLDNLCAIYQAYLRNPTRENRSYCENKRREFYEEVNRNEQSAADYKRIIELSGVKTATLVDAGEVPLIKIIREDSYRPKSKENQAKTEGQGAQK